MTVWKLMTVRAFYGAPNSEVPMELREHAAALVEWLESRNLSLADASFILADVLGDQVGAIAGDEKRLEDGLRLISNLVRKNALAMIHLMATADELDKPSLLS